MGLVRFLLALSVLVVHTGTGNILGLTFTGGVVAVESFYIISGFYMALILNEKYVRENNSYMLFVTNRFLRIFPVYLVVLFLVILKSVLLYVYNGNGSALSPYLHVHSSTHISSFLFFWMANLFIFGQDVLLFLRMDEGLLTLDFYSGRLPLNNFLLIPQAWTLSIELMFYLIAPFIVRRRMLCVFLLAMASLGLRAGLYRAGLNFDPWSYRFFPTELVFFFLGILSYGMYKKTKIYIAGNAFSILLVVLASFSIVLFQSIPGKEIKLVIWYACLALGIPFIFTCTKNSRLDHYLGELSYPIYISHVFIIGFIRRGLLTLQLPGNYYMYVNGVCCAAATVLFSMMLHRVIEQRVENVRQKRIK